MWSRKILNKGLSYLTNSDYRFIVNSSHFGMYHDMPDDEYLKRLFRYKMGYELNLDNPKTFNEKLQWLKLYDRKPIYTKMVDKYAVKAYVAEKIGAQYIIPTLGVWEHFDEIDFDKLPDQFVLKCTHDSGGLAICKNKATWDKKVAKTKLEKSLKRNFFYSGREWPYKNVKPRILAEQYMEDDESEELTDYKFMCFNGKVHCSFVCTERFTSGGLKVTFFDREWNKMPFERHYPASVKKITKPANYNKMIELAEVLSTNIPFVRVDFYETKKQIYFGELTFYPGNGLEEFTPLEWDYRLGSWIKLPTKTLSN